MHEEDSQTIYNVLKSGDVMEAALIWSVVLNSGYQDGKKQRTSAIISDPAKSGVALMKMYLHTPIHRGDTNYDSIGSHSEDE